MEHGNKCWPCADHFSVETCSYCTVLTAAHKPRIPLVAAGLSLSQAAPCGAFASERKKQARKKRNPKHTKASKSPKRFGPGESTAQSQFEPDAGVFPFRWPHHVPPLSPRLGPSGQNRRFQSTPARFASLRSALVRSVANRSALLGPWQTGSRC